KHCGSVPKVHESVSTRYVPRGRTVDQQTARTQTTCPRLRKSEHDDTPHARPTGATLRTTKHRAPQGNRHRAPRSVRLGRARHALEIKLHAEQLGYRHLYTVRPPEHQTDPI